MSASLGQFIREYLITLGIADAEVDDYVGKALLTAVGKAALELEENEEDRIKLTRAADEVERGAIPPEGLIERVFPDGRYATLFIQKVGQTLMEITMATGDAMDDETARQLAGLIKSLGKK